MEEVTLTSFPLPPLNPDHVIPTLLAFVVGDFDYE